MILREAPLPRAAPAAVLAVGAYLKNSACLLQGERVWWSPVHGDLGTPEACRALDASVDALVHQAQASGAAAIAAVAHDLHPDFHSTRVALRWAQALGVPAIGVQHHHAHLAAVQAEHGLAEPVLGWALDGVGLGDDGHAWGGELLALDATGAVARRLAHLAPLALPGGDVAAREPWRLAAALLHAAGRADEIEQRFGAAVGVAKARGVAQMLARGFNCPPSTGGGRWFDAAAGALGLSVCQAQDAEAALALEAAATRALASAAGADAPPLQVSAASCGAALRQIDLAPFVLELFATPPAARDRAAARFHRALADALVALAVDEARAAKVGTVVLGGGCFFNAVLSAQVAAGIAHAGLTLRRPDAVSCGDAGLALGQAWAAAARVAKVSPASASVASAPGPLPCLQPHDAAPALPEVHPCV